MCGARPIPTDAPHVFGRRARELPATYEPPAWWEARHTTRSRSNELLLADRNCLDRLVLAPCSGRRLAVARGMDGAREVQPQMENAMSTFKSHAPTCRRRRSCAGFASAVLLASASLALPIAAPAADDDPDSKNLTVEQNALYTTSAPAPAAATSEPLEVVAWVDHQDNTYAVGERVRLFVRANKDAYLTVLNVGASGQTTVLFPNAHQTETRVAANQIVEVPSPNSGASIRVGGPTGRELIKVIASTNPTPLFAAGAAQGAGLFAILNTDSRSVAKDLQVTMNASSADGKQEWDDYNKVITTIESRPTAVVPLAPAPTGTAWPAQPFGLRVAAGKPAYRMGEPVHLYVSTTAPCYLTLLNIGSSGQVRVLLPNAAQPQNLIPGGQTVVFPVSGSHLQLTPIGPPGVETVVAKSSADNQPVFTTGLTYGRSGYAAVDLPDTGRRDLGLVMSAPVPNRQIGQATVGFVVTQ